ncbi:unnamed protein product, partial [Phaeothamnion confervicola]
TFWYVNLPTRRTTYEVPEALLAEMFCRYEPCFFPYVTAGDRPCSESFTDAAAFRSHRLHAHPWWCAACGRKNPSLCFPACALCGNRRGADGEKLETTLRTVI